MRILMIAGSPHKRGFSNLPAERFMEGPAAVRGP